MPSQKKVLLIGDEGCGKTGLIFSYLSDNLPDPAVPTIYKEYYCEVETDNKKVPLQLWIAPVQEHYNQIRPLSYPDTDVVVLCFSVGDPQSLDNAIEKWFPEVREHLPKVPVFLVGNKTDQRTDETLLHRLSDKSLKPVSYEEAKSAAEKLNVLQYHENSAMNNEGVEEVFKAVAAATL